MWGNVFMTNITRRWTVGLSGMLGWLALGCSGGADSTTPETTVQLNEAGFISVPDSAEDPGYCGYRNLGVSEDGSPIVAQERYYYEVINQQLSDNVELRDAAGFSTVSTCEAARRFIKVKNEYQPANPGASAKAQLLANFAKMPAEPPKHDPDAPVEKVLNPNGEYNFPEMLGWGYALNGKKAECSAVRLSGVMFMTSAHCLALTNHPASVKDAIAFEFAWIKHLDTPNPVGGAGVLYKTTPKRCKNLPKGRVCAVLQLDALMNPNYAGQGDYANDIAVVHVRIDSQQYIRSAPNAAQSFSSEVGAISTVTPNLGDSIRAAGWGPDGDYDQKLPETWVQRTAVPVPINARQIFVLGETKGVYNGSWISTTAQLDSQLCKGDSGGPWFDASGYVQGLTSSGPIPDPTLKDGAYCTKIGTDQFAARTDYQILSFVPKAMERLQKASDTTLCTCAFFPSSGDPTNNDHELPGAHMRCNIGCEDPNAWTPPTP